MEYFNFDLSCYNEPINAFNANGRVDANNYNNNYNIKESVNKATEHQINIISRNINCTEVSKIFFSIQNINLLQIGIRNKILNETNS